MKHYSKSIIILLSTMLFIIMIFCIVFFLGFSPKFTLEKVNTYRVDSDKNIQKDAMQYVEDVAKYENNKQGISFSYDKNKFYLE